MSPVKLLQIRIIIILPQAAVSSLIFKRYYFFELMFSIRQMSILRQLSLPKQCLVCQATILLPG